MVELAREPNRMRACEDLAVALNASPDHVAKVMQALSRANLVRSQRGLHGGFTLAPAPEALTVLDVVQAVDPLRRIRSCPLGLKGHVNLCPLHRRMDQALALVEKALRESTIAELLAEPDARKGIPIPLCS